MSATCRCHTNTYAACDHPGGCGSRGGCCSEQRAGTCLTCPTLRPDSPAREPNQPPVCDGDRRLIDRYLGDIARLVDELTNDEQPIIRRDKYQRIGVEYFKGGRRVVSLGEVWADPLAALGGVAPINSRSRQPSVGGTRERAIPIQADKVDLTAPARTPSSSWPDDQIGHLSAATVLDEWCRDIRTRLFPDHHLPPATVTAMAHWLRQRLEATCDTYPQIADYATSLRILRNALRTAAGETEPKAEHCDGVACRRCDLRTLYRQPDGDILCANPDCQAVLRDDEYQDWLKTLVAEAKIRRHAGTTT